MKLVVYKERRVLELFEGQRLVRTFRIGLGFSPLGTKTEEGDGRTPEGEYFVFAKNPLSRYHLSLGLSYPGPDDAERGLAGGLITGEEYEEILAALDEGRMPLQKTRLGGEIYIHGGGNARDWTEGCIALSDAEMTELFDVVPLGSHVSVLP